MIAPVTLVLTRTRQQDKITIKQISSQPAAYRAGRNLTYDAYEHDPDGQLKSVVRSAGPSDGQLVATVWHGHAHICERAHWCPLPSRACARRLAGPATSCWAAAR